MYRFRSTDPRGPPRTGGPTLAWPGAGAFVFFSRAPASPSLPFPFAIFESLVLFSLYTFPLPPPLVNEEKKKKKKKIIVYVLCVCVCVCVCMCFKFINKK